MAERDNLYVRVKSHLRNNGITDLTKFRIAFENGTQVISEWGYDNIEIPNPSTLPSLTPSELLTEQENMKVTTWDIYAGIMNMNQVVALSPIRTPSISSNTTGLIILQPGFYKFTVVGKRQGNASFTVTISTVSPPNIVKQFSVNEDYFDFSSFKRFDTEGGIEISTVRAGGSSNVIAEITLIIERL